MRTILILILLLVGFSLPVSADTSSQSWTSINFDVPLLKNDDRYRLLLELNPRYSFSEDRMDRVFLNSAVSRGLDKNLSLAIGYLWSSTAYNVENQDNLDELDEHRGYVQVQYSQDFSELIVAHRVRFEHRRFERDSEFTNRLRYQLRFTQPIWTYEKNTYGLTVFDEITYNLREAEPSIIGGWGRNRFFIGPYLSNQKLRFELGYVHDLSRTEDGWTRRINVLQTNVVFSF